MRNYVTLPVVGSTNAELKEKIKASSGAVSDVIAADCQTGGRGRLGRSFYSPAGGVYFSAAYPLNGEEKNIPFFTLLAGLAVSRALEELTGAKTLVKWPNDVYLHGKKLCGILTERIDRGGVTHLICGVGVNTQLSKEEIPEELAGKMTSLSAEGLPVPDKNVLIKRCMELLDDLVYEKDLLNETSPDIVSELNEKSYLAGKTVVYEERKGVCGKINADGSINILFGEEEKRIFTGELLPISDFRSPI